LKLADGPAAAVLEEVSTLWGILEAARAGGGFQLLLAGGLHQMTGTESHALALWCLLGLMDYDPVHVFCLQIVEHLQIKGLLLLWVTMHHPSWQLLQERKRERDREFNLRGNCRAPQVKQKKKT